MESPHALLVCFILMISQDVYLRQGCLATWK